MLDKKPWYQFQIVIDRNKPYKTKVVFPQDPCGNQAGDTVHQYLLDCGMNPSAKATVLETVYITKNNACNIKSLERLQAKFESKGATIVYASDRGGTSDRENFVTREEFLELKKLSTLVEEELASVEKELQQLKQSENQNKN